MNHDAGHADESGSQLGRDTFHIRGSPDIGIPVASWPVLGTVTNTYGVEPYLDSQALTNAHRYYRAEKVFR